MKYFFKKVYIVEALYLSTFYLHQIPASNEHVTVISNISMKNVHMQTEESTYTDHEYIYCVKCILLGVLHCMYIYALAESIQPA